MFGTTLNREYEIAADLLGLDEAGIADLAKNAVQRVVPARGRARPRWPPRSTPTQAGATR